MRTDFDLREYDEFKLMVYSAKQGDELSVRQAFLELLHNHNLEKEVLLGFAKNSIERIVCRGDHWIDIFFQKNSHPIFDSPWINIQSSKNTIKAGTDIYTSLLIDDHCKGEMWFYEIRIPLRVLFALESLPRNYSKHAHITFFPAIYKPHPDYFPEPKQEGRLEVKPALLAKAMMELTKEVAGLAMYLEKQNGGSKVINYPCKDA